MRVLPLIQTGAGRKEEIAEGPRGEETGGPEAAGARRTPLRGINVFIEQCVIAYFGDALSVQRDRTSVCIISGS